MLSRLILIGWIYAFLALGSAAQPVLCNERPFVEVKWTNDRNPGLELHENALPVVSLPKSFKRDVEANFPNLRFPESPDYQGDWEDAWKRYDELTLKRGKGLSPLELARIKQGKVPFVAFGDFNHDGRKDIAALLIGKEDHLLWKLVVFAAEANGYKPSILVSSRETVRDSQPVKRDYGPITRYSLRVQKKCRDGKECLVMNVSEAASFQYVWKRNRYEEIAIHD